MLSSKIMELVASGGPKFREITSVGEERELICLLLFTCNYVVFVWRGFFFLLVLGMGYVILLWHSLSLPYNYFLNAFKTNVKPLG